MASRPAYNGALGDLVALLEDTPPEIHPEEHPGEREIDDEYKNTFQIANNTKLNLPDLARMTFADLSKELDVPNCHLRICSLGCGDGSKDCLIVQAFLQAYPNTAIEYVGVDVLQAICNEAEVCISKLELDQHRLKVSLICRDFEKEPLHDLGSFDLVNCCNVLYYFKDLGLAVDKVLSLSKKGGRAAIVLAKDGGLSPLRKLLWKSEGRHEFWTSRDVRNILDARAVQYSISTFPLRQDFSQCIKEKFKSPVSRAVLDFTCQTKMRWYSDQAVELCIWHITDLSKFESGAFLLSHDQEIITAFV